MEAIDGCASSRQVVSGVQLSGYGPSIAACRRALRSSASSQPMLTCCRVQGHAPGRHRQSAGKRFFWAHVHLCSTYSPMRMHIQMGSLPSKFSSSVEARAASITKFTRPRV